MHAIIQVTVIVRACYVAQQAEPPRPSATVWACSRSSGAPAVVEQVVLLHGQERTWEFRQHSACCAAEQQANQTGSAGGSHDDQVRLIILRRCDDLLMRATESDLFLESDVFKVDASEELVELTSLRQVKWSIGFSNHVQSSLAKNASQQQVLGTVAHHDQIGPPSLGFREQMRFR